MFKSQNMKETLYIKKFSSFAFIFVFILRSSKFVKFVFMFGLIPKVKGQP